MQSPVIGYVSFDVVHLGDRLEPRKRVEVPAKSLGRSRRGDPAGSTEILRYNWSIST